jgi:hypothetical protein
MRRAVLAIIALCLGGCAAPVAVVAPETLVLAAEARPVKSALPPGPGCWGRDRLPAVIETETITRATGAGSYRSESRQSIVSEARQVWIQTPCYDELTPDTVITLQRALRARAYYLGALDGALSPETMAAIRRFQADHGLDTKVLSLKAARVLGLVATPV